jgi:predicted Zn-dependent protease
VEEAQTETSRFALLLPKVAPDALEGFNSARDMLDLAGNLLAGEIALASGQAQEAERLLRAAVAKQDALRYDEPPDWYYPARHHLATALLKAGQPAVAQQVCEEDLRRNPENGWALAALVQSLREQNKTAEAVAAEKRLKAAWSQADVPIPVVSRQ